MTLPFTRLLYQTVCVACVAGQIDSQCQSSADSDISHSTSASWNSTHHHHHLHHRDVVTWSGYLSSPNYPHIDALTADCWWTLTVQLSQTLRLTLYDFQLSVKTDNLCRDYLRIKAATMTPDGSEVVGSEVKVFEDCGSLGLQTFDIASSRVHLQFRMHQSSQAHRGFLVHYTGNN